jgi:hypothetical protein
MTSVAGVKDDASVDTTITDSIPCPVEDDAESVEVAMTGVATMSAEDTRDHASVDATLTDGIASAVEDTADVARSADVVDATKRKTCGLL